MDDPQDRTNIYEYQQSVVKISPGISDGDIFDGQELLTAVTLNTTTGNYNTAIQKMKPMINSSLPDIVLPFALKSDWVYPGESEVPEMVK